MRPISELADELVAGKRRALSRAITLIESTRPDDRRDALQLLDIIMPHTGNALRLGISGTPGVGKSTFIEAYGQQLIGQGQRIAALTIDPSSRLRGGSILGDKTRMPVLANDPSAFIRPTPSGSLLGGVARRSREVIALCEAAGFDTVLVETVGVGQSETEVSNMTDCYLLLLQPASGDTLQGIKRGIMELADIVVVNKADGALLPAARDSASHYMRALSLMPEKLPDWKCPVVLCSSLENTGLDSLQQKINDYLRIARESGHFQARRSQQLNYWLEDETIASLIDRFKQDPAIQAQFSKLNTALKAGQSPAAIAARFAKQVLNSPS